MYPLRALVDGMYEKAVEAGKIEYKTPSDIMGTLRVALQVSRNTLRPAGAGGLNPESSDSTIPDDDQPSSTTEEIDYTAFDGFEGAVPVSSGASGVSAPGGESRDAAEGVPGGSGVLPPVPPPDVPDGVDTSSVDEGDGAAPDAANSGPPRPR